MRCQFFHILGSGIPLFRILDNITHQVSKRKLSWSRNLESHQLFSILLERLLSQEAQNLGGTENLELQTRSQHISFTLKNAYTAHLVLMTATSKQTKIIKLFAWCLEIFVLFKNKKLKNVLWSKLHTSFYTQSTLLDAKSSSSFQGLMMFHVMSESKSKIKQTNGLIVSNFRRFQKTKTWKNIIWSQLTYTVTPTDNMQTARRFTNVCLTYVISLFTRLEYTRTQRKCQTRHDDKCTEQEPITDKICGMDGSRDIYILNKFIGLMDPD